MLLAFLPKKEAASSEALDVSSLSEEDKDDLLLLADLLDDPWTGYCAPPVTSSFHQSQARNRYIVAASQSGKTRAGAREAWMYACGVHPFRAVPQSAKYGLIAVGSLEGTAYTGVLKALWATRPHNEIDWKRTRWLGDGSRPTGDTIYMKSGTEIRIVSSRGGSTGAASVQADWVWIDEPAKKDRFSELLARTTQTRGHVWLTFTPYDTEQDLTWLKLYLEGDADRGLVAECPGWERFNMELSVDNCPWMDEQQVLDIWAQTPAWVADQRLKGSWDTPPADAYFVLDTNVHDISVPFNLDGDIPGRWVARASVDHGELSGHQHAVFFIARKVRPSKFGPLYAQFAILGEYVSAGRTSFEEDAAGIRKELAKIKAGLDASTLGELGDLSEPVAWNWTGDVNTAGKGMAGVTCNEALSIALGMRKDAIKSPHKGPGSIQTGLVRIKTAIDSRPCQIRIASGSTGKLAAPALWRSMSRHKGKEDETKHAVDALRYGLFDLLDNDSPEFRSLPEPARKMAFAMPTEAGR